MTRAVSAKIQALLVSGFMLNSVSYAASQDEGVLQTKEHLQIEEVLITGGRDQIKTLPGSAHFIDSEALEAFFLYRYTPCDQRGAPVYIYDLRTVLA